MAKSSTQTDTAIKQLKNWPKLAQRYRAMSEEQREEAKRTSPKTFKQMWLADLRERSLESFWVFLTEVIRNPVLYEPLHKPLAEWLQEFPKPKLMLLAHRGSIKSNAYNCAYALWRACKDHNLRILIASHKDEDADKFVAFISRIITDHAVFGEVFPDVRPATQGSSNGRPKMWNPRQLLIERDASYVEPTIQGVSIRSNATGRHYDLLICDDLVTDENVNSEDLIKKTQKFHELCESLLDPGAEEIVIGTRYHYEDEYGRILETPELRNLYDVKIIPDCTEPDIVKYFIDHPDEWTPQHDLEYVNFPKRFTLAPYDHKDPDGDRTKNKKSLVQTRLTQGSEVYANQYQLEPRDPTDRKFRIEDIPVVGALPDLPLEYYQFLDHASERRTQSHTALVTAAVAPNNDIYIVDVFWGDYSNRQVTEELLRWQLNPHQRPMFVGIEGGPYELSLRAYIEERQREMDCYINFVPLTGEQHNTAKFDHIMSLQPWVECQKIRVLRDCRNRVQLLDEFDKFPKTNTVDCIDALAQITKLVLPGREPNFLAQRLPEREPEKPTGITMDEAVERLRVNPGVIGRHQVREPAGMVRF